MEQQRIEHYDEGYNCPQPIEIGRWYESLSPEEMARFREDMTEIEKRPHVYKLNTKDDDEHEWCGDIMTIFLRSRGDA